MTRKDSEKDSERPHYYSQFWLDVAAGRRVIGGPKPDEGTEVVEPETPEPVILRKSGRNSSSDGYGDTYSRAAVEIPTDDVLEPETEAEPELEPEEFEMADEVDDLDLPNILVDDTLDEAAEESDLAEMDTDFLPEDEEDEDFFDEEEEEEEDEDWPIGRGRKKPKPGRQVKQPKQPKKPRRDTRRGGF